jgi:octanoyl-[GcvH]:protein N-octanoyltransferase
MSAEIRSFSQVKASPPDTATVRQNERSANPRPEPSSESFSVSAIIARIAPGGRSLEGMAERPVRLLTQGFPDPPTMDTAVSHAILRRVSDGDEPETFRLHRPGAIVAFGPLDRHEPGYAEAIAAARAQGFGAIQRLAGGRAAVFDQDTLAFSWAIPDPSPRTGIGRRFEELASIVASAFRSLGVDARVGAVAGEYCPGEFSVNARGKTKLMGVGQRIVIRAAHVGGVVVVGGSDRVRDVLVPVNRALGLDWDPSTVGSLQDEVPGVTWADASRAILEELGRARELIEGQVTGETLALARTLSPRHEP